MKARQFFFRSYQLRLRSLSLGAAVALLVTMLPLISPPRPIPARQSMEAGPTPPISPEARGFHTANLLADGDVLLAGGSISSEATNSAVLYHPASATWSSTGDFSDAGTDHTSTLLADGRVLIAGGYNSTNAELASAELYDPASGTWSTTGSMNNGRWDLTAALLNNGKVL